MSLLLVIITSFLITLVKDYLFLHVSPPSLASAGDVPPYYLAMERQHCSEYYTVFDTVWYSILLLWGILLHMLGRAQLSTEDTLAVLFPLILSQDKQTRKGDLSYNSQRTQIWKAVI